MTSPVQIIKTPRGEELVVLSRADYEALLQAAAGDDDAELIAIAEARQANPQSADGLPPEVSRLLLSGMGLLRALRTWRDVGQVKLASDIGTSQGFVSDLESARRSMTDDVRRRIAEALDIPLHWLP